MGTTFFEQQAQARKRSSQLVFLYGCAVILIIFAVYLVVYIIWSAALNSSQFSSNPISHDNLENFQPNHLPSIFQSWLFIRVALITGCIIAFGTFYKILILREGGAKVAESLGARRIDPSTQDANERKAINVVEEMAIASGLAVPSLYVLDSEVGINAFAAGYSTKDAIITLTKGCLEKLKREELQGVVGHEFSHILNGDMRLNIKLLGTLHGILLLALIGETLMRISRNSGSKNDKGIGFSLVITGLGLLIIGYIGVFFGRIIKSAVSRQREFLADASSIQFTRNPSGLIGALKKIFGLHEGSDIQTARAEEISHMFFANAFSGRLVSIFATHPPILERIKRLQPEFNATKAMIEAELRVELEEARDKSEEVSSKLVSVAPKPLSPDAIIESVGKVTQNSLLAASGLIQSLNPNISSAIRNELGSRALVLGIILYASQRTTKISRDELHAKLGNDLGFALEKLSPFIKELKQENYLTIINLCMPTLRRMTQEEYLSFRRQTYWLMKADNIISFFEFAVSKMLIRNLDGLFVHKPSKALKQKDIKSLKDSCITLLTHLAIVGDGDIDKRKESYIKALRSLNLEEEGAFPSFKTFSLEKLDKALESFDFTEIEIRQKVFRAACLCVSSDGLINPKEQCLIRAVGSHLDCPVPLL
ncbi:MAG: M48 family metallopeptidase [SAR324 cluster bacterium]|uniref:M48 family metallopeptidase n=1 Tax=SAR324 cluster bacterium TaxID=2024889 RepID=A0A7X9FTS1_9DELT|nr:M48 family metallopeptidase [SAR324 cluster bacterium]